MMELYLNMLIEWQNLLSENSDLSKDDLLTERIIFIDESSNELVVIDIFDPKAFPFLRRCNEIKEAILSKNAKILEKDPFDYILRPEGSFSESSKKTRDEAWEFFEPLIINADIDLMLNKKVRADKIRKLSTDFNKRASSYWSWLRKWWQGGQVKNTLLPNFQKCGGKGNRRITENQNDSKLGRHSRNQEKGKNSGIRITPEIEKKFEKGTKKFKVNEGRSLIDTFELIKTSYFISGTEIINGITIPIIPPDEELPSFGQYRYWYETIYQKKKKAFTDIYSERDYLNNKRPILGDSSKLAFGPGSICQFDSTISNVYLKSQLDPLRIVGRPVTYLGADTFSHLIMGFASIFEGPSWKGAMLALDNIAANKVDFCAKYGIPIDEEDWNCQLLPEGILADRGEMRGYKAEPLVALGCRVYTTPSYRADFKGIVERHHGRAEEKFIKFIPGYVPHPKERGDPDYILKSAIPMLTFRRLLILYIVEYNNFAYLKDYKKDTFMIADQVKRYPIDIWNWGIQHRSGHLRVISRDMLRLNLLPRKTVSVTPRGIHFEKELYYTCDLAIKENWFERTKNKKMRIEIAYNPDSTDMIYLPLNGGILIEYCYLTEASKHLKGQNWYDAVDYFALESDAKDADTEKRKKKKLMLKVQKEAILSDALKLKQESLVAENLMSKTSRKANIKLNRQIEKLVENPLMDWLSDNDENADIELAPGFNNSNNLTSEDEDNEYVPRPSKIGELRKLQEDL
jgi:putative transposase